MATVDLSAGADEAETPAVLTDQEPEAEAAPDRRIRLVFDCDGRSDAADDLVAPSGIDAVDAVTVPGVDDLGAYLGRLEHLLDDVPETARVRVTVANLDSIVAATTLERAFRFVHAASVIATDADQAATVVVSTDPETDAETLQTVAPLFDAVAPDLRPEGKAR